MRYLLIFAALIAILSGAEEGTLLYILGTILLGLACGIVAIGIRITPPNDEEESKEEQAKREESEALRKKYERDLVGDYLRNRSGDDKKD